MTSRPSRAQPFLAMLAGVAVTLAVLVPTPRAHAAIPTVETNPVVVGGIFTSASAEFEQSVVAKILNGIAWAVAKTTIQSLTRSMVNWINSGFEGSPAFVTDLEYNLGRLQDTVADEFFDSLADNVGIDVRSPFQDQISDYLRESYYRSTGTDGFWSRNLYTAHENEADAQAFISGEFRRGGWDAWMKTMLNDSNNPIGAFYRAQDELFIKIENARVTRLNELAWGRGFLAWRGDCISRAPSASNGDVVSTSFGRDAEGNITTTQTNLGSVSLKDSEKCYKYEVKTPGSVVEQQLGITLGSPLRQLELADSINEIVGALVSQMVTQVLGGTGLVGVSRPASGGGRSYIDRATDASQYESTGNTSIGQNFISYLDSQRTQVEQYKANWEKIRTAVEGSSCADTVLGQATLAEADASIAEADNALAQIAFVTERADLATSDASLASAGSVSSQFQQLLSSGLLPSADEVTRAAVESMDTSDVDGEDSLYTKFSTASRTCPS